MGVFLWDLNFFQDCLKSHCPIRDGERKKKAQADVIARWFHDPHMSNTPNLSTITTGTRNGCNALDHVTIVVLKAMRWNKWALHMKHMLFLKPYACNICSSLSRKAKFPASLVVLDSVWVYWTTLSWSPSSLGTFLMFSMKTLLNAINSLDTYWTQTVCNYMTNVIS